MITRRNALAVGISGVGAALAGGESLAIPKYPGETRVIFLIGDYWHNGTAQEFHWRRVLDGAGFRFMFAQSSQFVTPAALDRADLFVVARYAGPDSLGWTPDPMIEDRPSGAPWMTGEQETAIVENVRRGMGLLSMHCSIWNPESTEYMTMLGVREPKMHGPVQPVKIHDINPDHPITRGIEPFDIGLDENFGADIDASRLTLLYRSTGGQDGRVDNAAWCREEERGRVVSLLFGHTQVPFHTEELKTVMWRSAHWALGRDIPDRDFSRGY